MVADVVVEVMVEMAAEIVVETEAEMAVEVVVEGVVKSWRENGFSHGLLIQRGRDFSNRMNRFTI